MTYLEFLKEFDIRTVVYGETSDNRVNYTDKLQNEFDILAFVFGFVMCGSVNVLNKIGNPYRYYYRIKTTNAELKNILTSTKIVEYVKTQPIKTYSLNTQSIQNILWILYKEK